MEYKWGISARFLTQFYSQSWFTEMPTSNCISSTKGAAEGLKELRFLFAIQRKTRIYWHCFQTPLQKLCDSSMVSWANSVFKNKEVGMAAFFKMPKNLTKSALKCMCASSEKERMQINLTETNSTVIPMDQLSYDSNTNRSSIQTEMNSSQKQLSTH